MTSFDGGQYGSLNFVYPAAYAADSPFTGAACSTTLANLYYIAANKSRLVFQQCFGWNDQTPEVNVSEAGFSCIATAHSKIADVYARIPEAATHLTAFVTFGAMPVGGDATVQARMAVVPGGIDAGRVGSNSESVIQMTTFDSHLAVGLALFAPDWTPNDSGTTNHPEIRVIGCDVSLANLDITVDREIYVEACVLGDVPTAFRPWLVSGYWECR